MFSKGKKYLEWEEFEILDSEARFWTYVKKDPQNCFKDLGVIA